MNKELFLCIVHGLSECIPFFQQRRDATGRFGHSPLQRCTASNRLLAYGSAADTVDEYLRLAEITALSCLHNFTDRIIQLFGDEYLRRPTPEDLQRLLDIGEKRGFPGMVGSIDCMHWESITLPQCPKQELFAKVQEATRKDVERTFGVLQARFAIVRNPALSSDKEKIEKIMRACFFYELCYGQELHRSRLLAVADIYICSSAA
ncbi:unnamed protein product [Brassica oleracea var. botrytis]|uniref:DDE Tnp4 domain-containing protein n=1 Tax=Brassica oleracea TaxID=3712 RepID=A0A3P6EW57_BRAOL|nr:unnamed protein product [Brassica oleracea]